MPRDRNKDEERLTFIVGDAVWGGNLAKLEEELSAMRGIAIAISESNSGDASARLVAAMVADLTWIVGCAVRFQSTEPSDYSARDLST